MSFSGNSIVIKDDYSFERIENLKLGDSLIGPNGKEAIIIKIEASYKENNYLLKNSNFFPFYLGDDTEILTAKQFELLNNKTNKFETFIKNSEFINISQIFPTNYLCLPILDIPNLNEFKEVLLYGNIFLDSEIIKKDDKTLNLKIKNTNNLYSRIKDLEINCKMMKNGNLIYLNSINYPWVQNLDCKIHQKKIDKILFTSKKENIQSFLNTFIKYNTKLYMSEKEFRLYVESKILDIQLFYLLNYIYRELPFVELIEKDKVEYKKIAAANRKKKYSITMLEDNNTIIKDNTFFQEIEKLNSINKNIKMYNIETLDNEPFYLNNIIVRK